MTRDEYNKLRHDKLFIKERISRKTVEKGRVFKTPHICSLCGNVLTNYRFSKGDYIANADFYVVNLPSIVYINVCLDPNGCFKRIEEKGL